MLVATRTFTASNGIHLRAGRDQVVEDHELASAHPDAFQPAPDFPRPGPLFRVRAGAVQRPPDARPLTADERARVSERIAEIEREDRRPFERAESRHERIFWEQTERLLASQREAPRPEPDLFRLDDLYDREAEAELAGIDAMWEGGAPWQR